MAALDAGVALRDVQIAARHADPRSTTIYDRSRYNFARHAAYVVIESLGGGCRPDSSTEERWTTSVKFTSAMFGYTGCSTTSDAATAQSNDWMGLGRPPTYSVGR